MWKTAKFFIALLMVAALFTSTAGIALADDGQNSGGGQNSFWEMIAKAFNTTAEHAKNVFMRVRDDNPPPPPSDNTTPKLPPAGDNVTPKQPPTGENREEMTLEQIDKLVADGKLTTEQATEYKAWLADRPDGPFVDKDRMDNLLEAGTITQEQYDAWKAWHNNKPDIELPRPGGPGQGNGNAGPNGQGNGDNRPQGNRPPPPTSDNTTPNQPPTGENHKPPPPPGGPGGNRR